jgi:hypothetical protein
MRHAVPSVIYQGTDITSSLAPFLESWQYDEAAEGSADGLTLVLTNTDLRWLNSWLPSPGDSIQAKITSYDWNSPGEVLVLDAGVMQVDDPEYSGPPDILTLKALQIPANRGLTDLPLDTTWQLITMSQLGQEIASKYGMAYSYEAPTDFTIHALKRTKQADAALLSATCKKYNLCLKIYSNKLVIYSKMILEQQAPVATITYGSSSVQNYTLQSPLVGTGYTGCTILYKPTKTKTLLSYTFPPGATGKVMVFQLACDDSGQAEMLAQGKLREANEKARTGTFTLALNLNITAACVVALQGWGQFDGNYFVDKCTPSGGKSAATTQITIHKCLTGGY